jgi:Na+/melibiose symporter-like transporter
MISQNGIVLPHKNSQVNLDTSDRIPYSPLINRELLIADFRMIHLTRLLVFTFIQEFATVLVHRGVYFYTREALGFGETENLLLALCMGAVYVIGALPSHRVADWFGNRRAVLCLLAGQIAMLASVYHRPQGWLLAVGFLAFSWLNAMMWPIVESYVSAGLTPLGASRSIGKFNVAWSVSVPLAVWASGPIIQHTGAGLFLCAAGGMVVPMALVLRLQPKPRHLAADHPERPSTERLRWLGALMISSRSSMVAGYAMLFVLSPLLPVLLSNLGYTVVGQTALAGFLDAGRAVIFLVMQRTQYWHGRRSILALTAILIPIGFLLALSGGQGALIAVGLFVFGASHGVSYYASLYYAMVTGNAAVKSAGMHEGLVGAGFVLGPTAALVGRELGSLWHQASVGILAGVSPIVVFGAIGGLCPLLRANRSRPGPSRHDIAG